MNSLWVEKYRPTTVSECILPDNTRTLANKWVSDGQVPHLILSGPAGTGKTSLALALINDIGADYIQINGSNEGRQLDTLRNSIVSFASAFSFEGKPRIVFIDEADYMTASSMQPALRTVMEEFSDNCRFILTANKPDRLIKPLQSRCFHVRLTMPQKCLPDMLDRTIDILDREDVEHDGKKLIGSYLASRFPDFRGALMSIEQYSKEHGRINAGIFAKAADTDTFFRTLQNKDFKSARRWLAMNLNNDSESFYRAVYDSCVENITDDYDLGMAMMIIHDYMFKSHTVADQEVNAAAFAAQMIKDVF